MTPSDLTTIKVSKTLRDRISAGASERRQTVQKFIEGVLEDYERRGRLSAVAAAKATADDATRADCRTIRFKGERQHRRTSDRSEDDGADHGTLLLGHGRSG